jgi:hypothetical protein
VSKYKEQILNLRDQGKNYEEIVAELGCAKSTVAYWLGNNQADKTAARTKRYRDKAREYIVRYKESNPCADCNSYFPYYVMDFDHLPEHIKEFQISSGQSLQRKLREMVKCELVCANCHRIRTHNRR